MSSTCLASTPRYNPTNYKIQTWYPMSGTADTLVCLHCCLVFFWPLTPLSRDWPGLAHNHRPSSKQASFNNNPTVTAFVLNREVIWVYKPLKLSNNKTAHYLLPRWWRLMWVEPGRRAGINDYQRTKVYYQPLPSRTNHYLLHQPLPTTNYQPAITIIPCQNVRALK